MSTEIPKISIVFYICKNCRQGAHYDENRMATMACGFCGDVKLELYRSMSVMVDMITGFAVPNEPVERNAVSRHTTFGDNRSWWQKVKSWLS